MLLGTKSPNLKRQRYAKTIIRKVLCIETFELVLLFIVILHSSWRRLRLREVGPAERACGVDFEPRPYAVQVEHMLIMAGQTNNERVFVVEIWHEA